MILAAKYKKRFLEDMVKHFPKDIESRIYDIDICRRVGKTERHSRLYKHDFFDEWFVSKFPNLTGWIEMCEFRPDIIYTDHITYVGWYIFLLKRFKGINPFIKDSKSFDPKLVYHIRGHWFKEYFANVLVTPSKYLLSLPLMLPLTLFGFKQCDALVPICDWLDQDLVAKMYPLKKSFTSRQGIDTSKFYKDEKNVFEQFKHPCVGILQSMEIIDKVRGLLRFIKVIKSMPHVHFYVCGGGCHQDKVIKQLRACENVTFKGSMNYPDDVRKFYNSVDVFVLPSGLDCCPTTILEAGLCEVPVCASRVGGIPELIKDRKTGFLIDNDYEWESKIQLLIDDKLFAKKVGKLAREHVKKNFDWRVLAPNLAEFLKGLITND